MIHTDEFSELIAIERICWKSEKGEKGAGMTKGGRNESRNEKGENYTLHPFHPGGCQRPCR
ncbi:MAG: hypothetical protein KAS51_07300 [Candidatus Omnitrophica bacterium]|nr:hypothetical protein [Candidatus Omnitrophota bacterium]